MIRLYCRRQHGGDSLCPECAESFRYARERLEKCPHGNNKPSCRRCAIHCFQSPYRENIVRIMKGSGPRMMLHHPLLAIRHLLAES